MKTPAARLAAVLHRAMRGRHGLTSNKFCALAAKHGLRLTQDNRANARLIPL